MPCVFWRPFPTSAVFLKPVRQLIRIYVFIPIAGAAGNDPDQRRFGDDFGGEEAQGRACDGGAEEPAAGFQVWDCCLEKSGG
jgi:hypothetical protein